MCGLCSYTAYNVFYLCRMCHFTLSVSFYTLCVVLRSVCSFTLGVQFHTRCVVLHSLCSFTLTVQFYTQCAMLHFRSVQFYTQCVILQTVCNFHNWCPNKPQFTLFCCKIQFLLIYALFGVKFLLQKSCLCNKKKQISGMPR